MMSRHCFFRVMKEDFRHRIWMLALSVLGNMLAIPVVYLMTVGEYRGRYMDDPVLDYVYGILGLRTYFGTILLGLAGFIAICGALIVGFAGFRYLFHKNMVDTYHGIPVKRRTLFAATWLNGFLIWLVPFLTMLLLTLVLGEIRLSSLREKLFSQPQFAVALEKMGDGYLVEQMTEGRLLFTALQIAGILIISFLLVYNLCLVAVMLCGNVLNTLTLAVFLGVGAIALYGLGMIFCAIYLDTFLGESTAYRQVIYASPLASSIYLLVLSGMNVFEEGEGGLLLPVLINLAIAVGMGAAAFFLYLRRPSELAEQGVKMKPVKFVVQVMIALAGVMGGWLIFCGMTDTLRGTGETPAWGIFGALLAGILAFGVMDIIMNMDFKAFFRHKFLMAATIATGLLFCFAFRQDWFGYDSYLPREQQIAEISIWMSDACNQSTFSYDVTAEDHPLQSVHIRDSAAAHAFLVEATGGGGKSAVYTEEDAFFRKGSLQTVRVQSVYVKVTLKSGRKYYRRYSVTNADCDAAYALVETKEYRDANYAVSPEEIAQPGQVRLRHMGYTRTLPEESARRFAEDICTAYNRDLEENPGAIIKGTGRLFSIIQVGNRNLEVFEGMSHTRAALRKYGYENYADSPDVKDVAEIRLRLNNYYKDADLSKIDLVADARRTYGVFGDDGGETIQESEPKPAGAAYEIYDEDTEYEIPDEDMLVDQWTDEDGRIALSITDPGEIRELLGLLSYEYPRRTSIFSTGEMTDAVQLVTAGNIYTVRLYKGALPEKYILRFGELQKALMQK